MIMNSEKTLESLMHEKAKLILRQEQLQNYNYVNEIVNGIE